MSPERQQAKETLATARLELASHTEPNEAYDDANAAVEKALQDPNLRPWDRLAGIGIGR